VTSGPGSVSGNILSATGTGNINIEYKYTNICTNTASQTIVVNNLPVATAGPDQELKYVFETTMGAALNLSETGEWSLVSGSGQILDINSPVTRITDLKIGENIFEWTVKAGSCESSAVVKITVFDLFIPSAITPNGDGKNDYFKINALIGRVELIIFNRWGNVEYTNDNYQNDWDGRNSKGAELPNDTYMYLIKFESGLTKKGSVLITR
jgi:trimeric autotransporter adhesin